VGMAVSLLVESGSRFVGADRYAAYRFGCRELINKSPSAMARWCHS
jgi:hypothetical protein